MSEDGGSAADAAATNDVSTPGAEQPAAPAAPPVEPDADQPAWYEALPETLRDDPNIAKFHSGGLEALAKAYVNTSKIRGVSADNLATIPTEGDVDGMRSLMGKLGLPETPDDYKLRDTLNEEGQPLGEGFGTDGDLAKVFTEACYEANVPPQFAQKVYDKCNTFLHQATQAQAAQAAQKEAQNVQRMKEEYGAGAFEQKLNAAEYVAQELDIIDVLREAGVGSDPRVVNALSQLAPLYREASGSPGLPTNMGGNVSKAELLANAKTLQAEMLSMGPNDPRKKELNHKITKLYEDAYRS